MYLSPNDYLRYITELTLKQIISSNPVYQTLIEQAAQEDFSEVLSPKYDLSKEFTDTTVYDPASAYNSADRVYLDALPYLSSKTYALGVLTLNGDQIYQCITAVTSAEPFDPAKWQLLGNQYDMFYVRLPYPEFDLVNKWYNVGDNVFWKNRTYTALQKSILLTHEEQLQYYRTNNIPFQNVFPDDPVNGPSFWKDNGAFIVPAGNLLTQNPATYFLLTQVRDNILLTAGTTPGMTVGGNSYQDSTYAGWDWYPEQIGFGTMTAGSEFDWINDGNGKHIGFTLRNAHTFAGAQQFVIHFQPIISQTAPLNPYATLTSQQIITTYFTKGDNRNQKVLQNYISLTLYYLYWRLSPKNIPETRINAYKEAKVWLSLAMEGKIKPNLAPLQPPQGRRVRSGSMVKLNNTY